MDTFVLKKIIYDQNEIIKKINIMNRTFYFEENFNYILLGIRRCGKSSLLYNYVKQLINKGIKFSQIIYINFDDERLAGFNINDFDDILVAANEISDEEHFFFFDEIQNITGWEKFARRLADQKYNVWITGSNAKMLSNEMEEALGGRYLSKTIYTFSFKEYLQYINIDILNVSSANLGRINANLIDYLNYGGFAESINAINKKEYVSNVFQKVLLNDIILHNSIRNINSIKLLIKKIADVVGNDVSFTKLQNLITCIGYKISKDVIIDYVGYIKNAFLLFETKNYYSSFLDKESNSKYYFMDNGLLSLFVDNQNSKLLENLVAITLYKNHKDNLYYIKSSKTNIDIDFYVADAREAYQVCYSLSDSCIDREIKNLVRYKEASNNNVALYIITYADDKEIQFGNNTIYVKSLKTFLLN